MKETLRAETAGFKEVIELNVSAKDMQVVASPAAHAAALATMHREMVYSRGVGHAEICSGDIIGADVASHQRSATSVSSTESQLQSLETQIQDVESKVAEAKEKA